MTLTDRRRALPSSDRVLSCPALAAAGGAWARPVVVGVVREEIERARRAVEEGGPAPTADDVAAACARRLDDLGRPRPRRVVNATGVVVHTNLGRAPLGRAALDAIAEAAGYCDLEFDVPTGRRGSRHAHVDELLRLAFPGASALVVNNNAAALLLVLNTFALGRGVVVSRGELVEIGGSFRVPEILERSGAHLREIGTTNRTHLRDYAAALDAKGEKPALLLKVWPSNYRVIGFTAAAEVPELAPLARRHEVPLVVDQGCGRLFRGAAGPASETSVEELLAAGADLVCFSGDKLLGGPQAGVIVGTPALVRRCAENPLARALRPDKLAFAALGATLRDALSGAPQSPAATMLSAAPETLRAEAERLADALRAAAPSSCEIAVAPGASRAGGGAAPEEDLPTTLVVLRGPLAEDVLLARLRGAQPPVVARAQDGAVVFDPRTLLPGEIDLVAAAVRRAFAATEDGAAR